jgi:hypothetical protein
MALGPSARATLGGSRLAAEDASSATIVAA